ncbi:single-stranded-DNA-specific exonuclease RecJ [Kingella oralis]|uniref:Single-stranded-DNA-specific exonuclease RecJ n=1 Tax=Kingella oralis ATCC 51147 TaxID=629741 RepID=C4GHJ8_9NEIS|nr:single-stranded-DNA-specific exonuclease RecJ [Kingella oralis]EEP68436.1 single-stranded-DNA-specific exonuclease RecJ [Kingella oralis ATCC 51147]QMT42239.1 single-stranded-DNA-specific exonuclease RecJ [Kingella oralis]
MSHTKRIATRPINPQLQSALQAAGANPLIAQLYAARNVADSSELNDSLKQLIPYTQLTNCTAAASRLADAIQAQQKILIIADYDADGATACSVAMKGLASMGAAVDFFVPNRFEHGYGLTPELADIAHAKGADLIVTVDNGISSAEGVARAKALGLDVIVTDHHIAGSVIPDCIIVNPNQRGCTFPSKSIAGVGVIFYVLIALRAELRARDYFSGCRAIAEPKLDELLDLVALGTVADVVPLDHNNRILVSQGLKRIRAGKMSHGIRALFQTARCSAQKAQPFDFGYKIAPRINAAGRLDDMSIGIACLLSGSLNEAESMASELNELNQTRQEIEQEMLTDILADCPSALPSEQTTLCVYRDSFHQGVVGIVASRLKEKFYRPVFVFAPDDDGNYRGSGRSIAGVHLRDVLDAISKHAPEIIIKFGGHAMAAGLTLRSGSLKTFGDLFEDIVRSQVNEDTLSQTFLTDGSLKASDITLANAQLINAQIWGQGFPPPSFADTFQVLRQQSMGADKKHTKAWLTKEGQEFEAMFWRCEDTLPRDIRVVYRPTVNEWRGNTELQLYVDYWEAA